VPQLEEQPPLVREPLQPPPALRRLEPQVVLLLPHRAEPRAELPREPLRQPPGASLPPGLPEASRQWPGSAAEQQSGLPDAAEGRFSGEPELPRPEPPSAEQIQAVRLWVLELPRPVQVVLQQLEQPAWRRQALWQAAQLREQQRGAAAELSLPLSSAGSP